MDNQKYIIRCDRAGVFFANVKDRKGSEAVLANARRIYNWTEAATLSQVATDGVGGASKLTCSVDEMTVLGVIELIPCTSKAQKCMEDHPVWKIG